ncbi:MAG: ABC transporter permease [Sphaerochaeta sp.]
MKVFIFASRNRKEIVRDKLNIAFGLGFPIILLLLMTAIQSKIPIPIFELKSLTPGVAVFGLSFISLFTGMLIAKDRTSSLMLRLFTSPMTSSNFIFGYTLPVFPLAIIQIMVSFVVAVLLGLNPSLNIILTVLVLIPVALLFIAIGLLCGSLFTDKQVGGICGALLTNLTGWLSGTWFDLDLVGGAFQKIAYALPFYHAVEMGRVTMLKNYDQIPVHMLWILGYDAVIIAIAIFAFTKKMHGDSV